MRRKPGRKRVRRKKMGRPIHSNKDVDGSLKYLFIIKDGLARAMLGKNFDSQRIKAY
jgi:hypothetical protein